MKGYIKCLLAAAAVLQVVAVPLYRQAEDVDEYDLDLFATTVNQCGAVGTMGQSCPREAFPVCNITEVGASGCSLANLTQHEVFNVITGNNTHCLNDSAPYYFSVMPASPKKLFLFFMGGGACWSDNITAAGACAGYPGGPDWTFFVNPNPYTQTGGVFNRSVDAPFQEYSLVVLPYCSGDLFIGDVVRVYKNDTTNETIAEARQSGVNNTMATLSWVFENYPNISQLLISGCSAGSLGAQAWANYIYLHYNTTLADRAPKTAVLADGYAGIFPENQRQLFGGYNGHDSPWASVLPVEFRERLANNSLYWCEATNQFQDSLPNVTYTASQAAYDQTQLAYFNALALQANKSYVQDASTPACANESVPVYDEVLMGSYFILSPLGFNNATQKMYKGYIERGVPNFVPYIVDTMQHCFLGYNNIYEMFVWDTATNRNVSLAEWLHDIPLDEVEAAEIDTDVDVVADTPELFRAVCDIAVPCLPEVYNHTIVVEEDDDVLVSTTPTAEAVPAATAAA